MKAVDYNIIHNANDKQYVKQCWEMAIGLQAVDDLSPSGYLYELADKNIEGRLTNEEIEQLLYRKYENETPEDRLERKKESDLVANRIVGLLSDPSFTFSPVTLKYIHRTLFEGIYDHAGMFRQYNISKSEPILNGETVRYANYQMIEDTLRYDFQEEKERRYTTLSKDKVVAQVSKFTSDIWQVHPFMEGNTRTTAVFMERYLNSKGFHVNNLYFAENSKFFRNALVRANFADFSKGIDSNSTFINSFFENLLFDGKSQLLSRDIVLTQLFQQQDEQQKEWENER